jgi:hypothetical protein
MLDTVIRVAVCGLLALSANSSMAQARVGAGIEESCVVKRGYVLSVRDSTLEVVRVGMSVKNAEGHIHLYSSVKEGISALAYAYGVKNTEVLAEDMPICGTTLYLLRQERLTTTLSLGHLGYMYSQSYKECTEGKYTYTGVSRHILPTEEVPVVVYSEERGTRSTRVKCRVSQ